MFDLSPVTTTPLFGTYHAAEWQDLEDERNLSPTAFSPTPGVPSHALDFWAGDVSNSLQELLADQGIDRQTIHRLAPVRRLSSVPSGAQEECLICMDKLEHCLVRQLPCPCSLMYHTSCIDQWLESSPTCPACRADLRTFSQ